jgi:hypothetical protein
MTDQLEMKVVLDRAQIPTTNVETELKCLVKIWPSQELRESLVGIEPMATSICLVFDCSTSMLQGDKLQTAIDSAKLIVDTISGKQRLSLVAFQSKVKTLISDAEATEEGKEKLKLQIDEIKSMTGGSTNMTDGVKAGIAVLSHSKADAKVLILLSDGAADFPETAERAAVEASKAGIQLFCIGIGSEYTADQLLKMATPSNGALFGSAEVDKIKSTFEKLISRIENFAATNVTLQIALADEVNAGLAFKASPEQAFIGNIQPDEHHTINLNVGNIENDKIYSFVFLLTVPQRDIGEMKVGQVRVTYDVPSKKLVEAGLGDVIIVAHTTDRKATEELSGEVMEVFRRVSITQLADRFVAAIKANQAESAAKYLNILIKRYEEIGDSAMKNHYVGLLQDLVAKGTITNEMLNATVVASTVVAGNELPNLVADDF